MNGRQIIILFALWLVALGVIVGVKSLVFAVESSIVAAPSGCEERLDFVKHQRAHESAMAALWRDLNERSSDTSKQCIEGLRKLARERDEAASVAQQCINTLHTLNKATSK